MADCNNCQDQSAQPCVSCSELELQMQSFCTEGCTDYFMTDCGIYNGADIITSKLTIKNGDNLTKIIKELSNNNADITLALTWNATTRQLCITKNGTVVSCQTIADSDDQYFKSTGTKLELWKPLPTGDIKVSEIDLSTLVPETALVVNSTTLAVSQSGTKGHTVAINFQASSDLGNAIKIGSDGKPFVATPPQSITDIVIADGNCMTWSKTYANGKVTLTPTIDWNCVASNTCDICVADSIEPINLNVTPA